MQAKLFTSRVFPDERGYFFESFRQEDFPFLFVQDNVSYSRKNVLRGLHMQTGQAKLVRCLHGTIWDVALDLRPASPTYLQHFSFELSDQNHLQLLVPAGFAHGFCVLSDSALVSYKVSALYDPKAERGFRWNDPAFQVPWPVEKPILSQKDQNHPLFCETRYAVDHRG